MVSLVAMVTFFIKCFLVVGIVAWTVIGQSGKEVDMDEDSTVPAMEEMKCVCDGGCESVLEQDCPWGLTLDVCGCCFLCARGDGEPCGGAHGTCAFGLKCHLGDQQQRRLRLGRTDSTESGTCHRRQRGRRRRK